MKRIIAFLLAMFMLLSLAACSRDFGEKRDIQDLETEETAEPSDDSGDDEDENSDHEKQTKTSTGSKSEDAETPSTKDYEYEYEYADTAYQYIWTENCRWIDTDGYWIDESYYTYYECSNCGYIGSSCPDFCDSCGAYFADWDWYDEYYTYVMDAETWSEIVDVYYDVW